MNDLPVERKNVENLIPSLRHELDRLVEELLGGWSVSVFGDGRNWVPAVDMTETDDDVTIRAEIPGVSEENIDVTLRGDVLIIRGEERLDEEDFEAKGLLLLERPRGGFFRRIKLPEPVDPEKVSADYSNGVLTVTMAKAAETPSRPIKIKASK